MPTVEINGTTINYVDSGGDGPAILFSHGFLMDHTMFDNQVAELSGDYRCVAWDERGFGDTAPNGDFSFWDSAADAVGLLDHLDIDRAVFVGMSQGGFLSMRAALANPERVRALVLIDSAAATDDDETIEGYTQMMAGMASGDEATIDAVFSVVSGLILGDEELAAVWIPKWKANLKKHDIGISGKTLLERDVIEERVPEIACPVLQIHGTEDQAIPLSEARKFIDNVPDARGLVLVEGAAHAPNMTHPDQVNPPLREFLASL